ncbi:phosphoribosyltransferase family protein [Enterovibrio makurazakiensis]|uniref:phosphoribosyltransferase domain-containing protein n=1 Tax=Enterovibrio makurazakiensis TaxID=2910232 RepID=UPI003D1E5E85
MQRNQHTISNGKLDIVVKCSQYPMDELLSFASRENPKRGYLFVSKVLGKHWAVKPSRMRKTYDSLSTLIGSDVSTFVVGMSETATGLGAGVADSLARSQTNDVYYQHTTRHQLNDTVWLKVEESHSHATSHLLYQPEKSLLDKVKQCQRLLLVDDEISTGKTLKRLGDALLDKGCCIEEVVIVSLVNWLDVEHKEQFTEWPVNVRFVSLLEGSFAFEEKPNLDLSLPRNTDKDFSLMNSRRDLGRLPIKMPYAGEIPSLNVEGPITIIGDGEHLYFPFLVAEKAESDGRDVVFQSTSRSPIMLGDAIKSKLSFRVDHREVEHYIYNLESEGRTSLHFIEDERLRQQHQLARHYPVSQYCESE